MQKEGGRTKTLFVILGLPAGRKSLPCVKGGGTR